MGKMLQKALKRPTHRKCTCPRCKAKAFVASVRPDLDDQRVLSTAEKILTVMCSLPSRDSGGQT